MSQMKWYTLHLFYTGYITVTPNTERDLKVKTYPLT